jgi:single-strand DNA-binding protein
METLMNKVMVLGNITQDLVVKSNDKNNWVKLIVAVDRGKDEADFFKAVAFGRAAEYLSKYAHKGSRIALEGRLTSDKYLDPKTNTNVYTVEIIIEKVWVLSRAKNETPIENKSVKQTEFDSNFTTDDDLPF